MQQNYRRTITVAVLGLLLLMLVVVPVWSALGLGQPEKACCHECDQERQAASCATQDCPFFLCVFATTTPPVALFVSSDSVHVSVSPINFSPKSTITEIFRPPKA